MKKLINLMKNICYNEWKNIHATMNKTTIIFNTIFTLYHILTIFCYKFIKISNIIIYNYAIKQ